ncbi:alpha/beta hydrolase [Actinophytocola sp.]|uniref:alpha/beta fold hydrolase n=1 Tax=Actinophytocola sp. TaxID=1872138 RepID=UPI002ED002CA
MRLHRSRSRSTLLAVAATAIGLSVFAGTGASEPTATDHGPKPTVVLVHGAFADASGWSGVIAELQRDGYPVLAPANPLRDLAGDAAYLTSVLATVTGPIVLVGHSYGGAVITNAALGNPNVKALVYVAGFAPEEGESIFALTGLYPGSLLPQNITARPFPQADGATGVDAYVNPANFREVFAADVSRTTAATMAASQRPIALAAGNAESGVPAWKTIPSWYLVTRADHAIPAQTQRFMAERANAHTVEVNTSHVPMIVRPGAVANLVRSAARNS